MITSSRRTRSVLSQLADISNSNLSNRIFGSEVMTAVIQCSYEENFKSRHIVFTCIFAVQVAMWLRFNLNFKYYDLPLADSSYTRSGQEFMLEAALVLTVIILLWHEVRCALCCVVLYVIHLHIILRTDLILLRLACPCLDAPTNWTCGTARRVFRTMDGILPCRLAVWYIRVEHLRCW